MSGYLQTSVDNPYGHRPWATRLYSTFEDYGFLKQPQNTILREDLAMRPELYKPPELKSAGLGDVTIVGGSGRTLRRARRRTMLGALPMYVDGNGGSFYTAKFPNYSPYPYPSVKPIVTPVSTAPVVPSISPTTIWNPPAPLTILPPSIVPPPPQLVASGPSGVVYSLPGNATTPGSPFTPPAPGELPVPSSAPPLASRSFSDWFNATDYVASVPNGYLALGGAAVVYFFARKKR